MRWLIIENALRDQKGRWLEYLTTFHDGLHDLSDEVETLACLKADPEIIQRLEARPVLQDRSGAKRMRPRLWTIRGRRMLGLRLQLTLRYGMLDKSAHLNRIV